MADVKELFQVADWKKEKHVPVIEAVGKLKKGEFSKVSVCVGKEIAHPNISIGCSLCTQVCPEIFKMKEDKAVAYVSPVPEQLKDSCGIGNYKIGYPKNNLSDVSHCKNRKELREGSPELTLRGSEVSYRESANECPVSAISIEG